MSFDHKRYMKEWHKKHKKEDKEYKLNHREEIKEYQQKWHQEHKEEVSARRRKYRQTKEGKAREKARKQKYYTIKKHKKARGRNTKNHNILKKTNGIGVTTQQWEDIVRKYNYRCAYCGKRCVLTQDHVIPVSKKGEHSPYNVVPACAECNSKKGVKLWKPRVFRKEA